ncbi:MAG: cereblon family protein [Deltaproteobacteria bacterium]
MYHHGTNGAGGNGAKAFQCGACGSLITHSDRLVPLGGTVRHLFVNPGGVECDFYTFSSCQGAIAYGEPTEEHTWFPGYAWCMAFCRQCGQHLGWLYEGVASSRWSPGFWGLLVSRIVTP